ncbi:MAG: fructose-1,6-bisphosphatase [Bacteroidales bacterium]
MVRDIKYLELLSKTFPTIQSASTEIINLEAIMSLPKGTEHFVTDLHGEYESFDHVLRNASGVIKSKVDELFGSDVSVQDKKELCTLIYYPKRKLKLLKIDNKESLNDWYHKTLVLMIKVLSTVSFKYTRSKVRKALPKEYSYIIEELLNESMGERNKEKYIHSILDSIISTDSADCFIIAIAEVIQRLTIDSLHIIGDVYDRGPGAHIIMNTICSYHNCDIQWGNHDIIWMGAAAGSAACMANVVRISLRYANLETLEDGYGINLLPLATFAIDTYKEDLCMPFMPKIGKELVFSEKQKKIISKMHKAITIIQFKLEGQLINRRPDFHMEHRNLLDKIDFDRNRVLVHDDSVPEGYKEYPLCGGEMPTVNPKDPYKLNSEEQEIVDKLVMNFTNNPVLEKHIRCLYAKGSFYKVANGNLLFHGSLPMNPDGSFRKLEILGAFYCGKELYDKLDQLVRIAYFEDRDTRLKKYALDLMWYIWCGPVSPSFDKAKMTTFERYFIKDKKTHEEPKGAYYVLKEDPKVCDRILHEFGINQDNSHIINGHIPVKTLKGESPIKADGKLLVIDGGYAKAYQPETGIAGYTLIYNSFGLLLIQHQPFQSAEHVIKYGEDIISLKKVIEYIPKRKTVGDTDIGKDLAEQVKDLRQLLSAYKTGLIRENL